jgi:hypothetical protein
MTCPEDDEDTAGMTAPTLRKTTLADAETVGEAALEGNALRRAPLRASP